MQFTQHHAIPSTRRQRVLPGRRLLVGALTATLAMAGCTSDGDGEVAPSDRPSPYFADAVCDVAFAEAAQQAAVDAQLAQENFTVIARDTEGDVRVCELTADDSVRVATLFYTPDGQAPSPVTDSGREGLVIYTDQDVPDGDPMVVARWEEPRLIEIQVYLVRDEETAMDFAEIAINAVADYVPAPGEPA